MKNEKFTDLSTRAIIDDGGISGVYKIVTKALDEDPRRIHTTLDTEVQRGFDDGCDGKWSVVRSNQYYQGRIIATAYVQKGGHS